MDKEMIDRLMPILLKHKPETKFGATIVLVELLQAMREPTLDMLDVGHRAALKVKPSNISGMTLEAQTKAICTRENACWKAMIDTIISEDI
jgi:hypothetical protein